MCGIALIVSGVRIVGFDSYKECCGDRALHSHSKEVYEPDLPIDDLKASLYRRGPDNLGCRKVLLHPHRMSSVTNGDEVVKNGCSSFGEISNGCTSSALQAAADRENGDIGVKPIAKLCFFGATLQLRGINAVSQPLVSTSGNILVYNGAPFYPRYLSVVSYDCSQESTYLLNGFIIIYLYSVVSYIILYIFHYLCSLYKL